MHCTCARSVDPSSGASPSTISPLRNARGDERPRHLVDDRADEVRRVHGLAGGRAHLGERPRTAAVLALDRREQQEVGEAEVGERLPRRREPLDVAQRLAPERGLRARLLEAAMVPTRRSVDRRPTVREEMLADAGEPGDVGDVGRRSSARSPRPRAARDELGAQLGFAARDDLVVPERVAERPQHARGARRRRRARRSPVAASSAASAVAVALEHVGRVLAVRRRGGTRAASC